VAKHQHYFRTQLKQSTGLLSAVSGLCTNKVHVVLPHVSLAAFQMLSAAAVCALTRGLGGKSGKNIDFC